MKPAPATRPKIGSKPTRAPKIENATIEADERRHEGLCFHILAIGDLDRQDRPAEGRPEDRPDAGSDARAHGDPGVPGVQVEDPGE